MFIELKCKDVGHQGVEKDQDSKQKEQPGVKSFVSVLLTNESLCSLGQKPVDNPNEQNESQRHHLVDVQRVAQDSAQQEELEDFLV